MSGLETAIRNALEKSDRSNAEVRARIYQSSRQALEAGLRKQGIDDPQVVAQQRQRLESLIHIIENEERNRLLDRVEQQLRPPLPENPVQDDHSVDPASQPQHHGDMAIEPELRGETRDARPVAAENLSAGRRNGKTPKRGSSAADASLAFRPEGAVGRRKRRGLFARLFIYLTLLAFIGFGAWWAYSSGLLLSPEQRDTSVPNPPAQVQAEDFTGAEPAPSLSAGRGFSDDWVEIFNAERGSSGISAGARATVENIATPAGKAIKVTSRSVSQDGAVSIEVPVEVMRDMAGKSSTISITLQSSSDRQTQVSVACDFATLGDCSRHRFTATAERADMLLNATFERSLAPNAPGKVFINSDIDGNSRPVNLYSVRILPGQ
ncbi:hypothetical protein G3A56_09390 [Rhizobium oryzihabitans]|uniref:Biotin transporter BioY n=1 Tax=Rhizobium oryzihabitans TaxID=2267833 RepID=A0A7L5BH42_9HYPH|nr:hypothetical protein [Rhizobium oryzihabitans]QCM03929.1 hypothetical protein CFBP6626_00520 [Agrobacterium tumefaciens]QIB38178.1 hypothetical protein G3A56_09390 [Rhizobium oryzihabitans]CUX41506.1 conserved hypothetical protein [Agrobacterium genomosp. 5 str. CFBP 6626]